MTVDEQKVIARQVMEIFNTGDLSAIDEHFAPDYVNHGAPPGLPPGREGTKVFVQMWRTAFPDVKITLDDLIADGDKVAVRWTATGTNTGSFMGMPATGRSIEIVGMDVVRFAGGKAVEHWDNTDLVGMLQQLGMMPQP